MKFAYSIEQCVYIGRIIRESVKLQNSREQRRSLQRIAGKFDARVDGVELKPMEAGAVLQMLTDMLYMSVGVANAQGTTLSRAQRDTLRFEIDMCKEAVALTTERLEEYVYSTGAR